MSCGRWKVWRGADFPTSNRTWKRQKLIELNPRAKLFSPVNIFSSLNNLCISLISSNIIRQKTYIYKTLLFVKKIQIIIFDVNGLWHK